MPAANLETRAISPHRGQVGVRAEKTIGVVAYRAIDIRRITAMSDTLNGQPPILAADGLLDVPHTQYGMYGSNGHRYDGIPVAGAIGLERPQSTVNSDPNIIPGVNGTYVVEPAIAFDADLVAAQRAFDKVKHGRTQLEPRELGDGGIDNVVLYVPEDTNGGRLITRQWQIVDPGKSRRDTLAELRRNVPSLLRGGPRDVTTPPEVTAAAALVRHKEDKTKKGEPRPFGKVLQAAKEKLRRERPDIELAGADALHPDRETPKTQSLTAIRKTAEDLYRATKRAEQQELVTLTFVTQELAQHAYGDLPLADRYKMAKGIIEEINTIDTDKVTKQIAYGDDVHPLDLQHYRRLLRYGRITREGQTKGAATQSLAPKPDPEALRQADSMRTTSIEGPVEVPSGLTPEGEEEIAYVNTGYIEDAMSQARDSGTPINILEIVAAQKAEIERIQKKHGLGNQSASTEKADIAKGHQTTVVTKAELANRARKVAAMPRRAAQRLVEAVSSFII